MTGVVIALVVIAVAAVLALAALAVKALRDRPEEAEEPEVLQPETVEEYAVVRAVGEAMAVTNDVNRALTLAMLGLRNYQSPETVAELLAMLERRLRVEHGRRWHERPVARAAIECWDFETGVAELRADLPGQVLEATRAPVIYVPDYDGPVYVGKEGDEPELVDEEYDESPGR